MHIPDGYLNPQTSVVLDLITAFFPQRDFRKGDDLNGSSSLAERK